MATRTTRTSPGYDDFDRLAENLMNNGYFPSNKDELSNDMADYFEGEEEIPKDLKTKKAQKDILKFVLFKSGGGKNLRRDQQQDAKRIYPNTVHGRREYSAHGADKTDLSGIDTKQGKRKKSTVQRREFNTFGIVQGKVVKVRRVKINGKYRYIDEKGRYATKKKKEK